MRIVPAGTAQRVEAKERVSQVPANDEIDRMTLPELREVIKSLVAVQKVLLELVEAQNR